MRYRVLPYRQGSRWAKALAEALGGRVLRLEGSTFVPAQDDVVINWGNTNSGAVPFGGYYYLNPFVAIRNASNKRWFFERMREANLSSLIPAFWTSAGDIPDEAFPVVCRTVLAGHSGAGIIIAPCRNDLVPAPLYTQYVKKTEEYRIHVGLRENQDLGEQEPVIIAEQRKARRHDVPDSQVNWQIRNHHNGFVYVREGFDTPEAVLDAARRALEVTGLDFGAVDIIWNNQKQRPFVLEVNTAPGLEGQTVQDYTNFFRSVT